MYGNYAKVTKKKTHYKIQFLNSVLYLTYIQKIILPKNCNRPIYIHVNKETLGSIIYTPMLF